MPTAPIQIQPQPGFQESFLKCPADIVIGGGAAGAGKSFALLMEPLRHSQVSDFGGVCFRRTMPQVKSQGGLWDTCKGLYGKLSKDILFTEQPPKVRFPSGSTLSFSHLQYERDVVSWDGSQIPLLMFDELIHFSEFQFWYMVGRNRTNCPVLPYIRATTNPQPFGWVKRLISWWIYPDNWPDEHLRGMPIPERSGVLRYYFKKDKTIYWGDSRSDVLAQIPDYISVNESLVKSFCFIPGTLDGNTALLQNDPSYEANLYAQDEANALRLRTGCWYMQPGADDLFTPAMLQDCFESDFVQGDNNFYMTADIAMEGSDMFVVGIWNGLRLVRIYNYPKCDGKQILDIMQGLAKEWRIWGSRIAFDSNGIGNFLTGFFRSAFDFRTQSRPIEVASDDRRVTVKQNFDNLRSQCLYLLADLMGKRQLHFAATADQQDTITQEFLPHKKERHMEVNRATAKETVRQAIGRSPDYADMILMRMVFLIRPIGLTYLAKKYEQQ